MDGLARERRACQAVRAPTRTTWRQLKSGVDDGQASNHPLERPTTKRESRPRRTRLSGKVIVGRRARPGMTLGVRRLFRYQSQFWRWSPITVVDVNGHARDNEVEAARGSEMLGLGKRSSVWVRISTPLAPAGYYQLDRDSRVPADDLDAVGCFRVNVVLTCAARWRCSRRTGRRSQECPTRSASSHCPDSCRCRSTSETVVASASASAAANRTVKLVAPTGFAVSFTSSMWKVRAVGNSCGSIRR